MKGKGNGREARQERLVNVLFSGRNSQGMLPDLGNGVEFRCYN